MNGVKRYSNGGNSEAKRARVASHNLNGNQAANGGGDSETAGSEDEEEEEDDDDEEDDEDEDEDDDDDDDNGVGALAATDRLREEQRMLSRSRQLNASMKNDRSKAAREGGLKEATERLRQVNEAFAEQHKLKLDNKTLEVYDSRNLLGTSDLMDIALRNVKLGTTGRVLKSEDFLRRLKTFLLKTSMKEDLYGNEDPEEYINQNHEFTKFNWFGLGAFAYSRGKKALTANHLFGPLEIEKKARSFKPREKLRVTDQVTTAENLTSEDINSASINQTPNAVQECFKVFQAKVSNPQRGPINIFKFFINPHSFSQSVENMFFTSFLIRDGRLKLGEDDEGYPTLSELPPLPTDQASREQEIHRRRELPSNHIIFQLEYNSWKKLIQKFHITESLIPNRPEMN